MDSTDLRVFLAALIVEPGLSAQFYVTPNGDDARRVLVEGIGEFRLGVLSKFPFRL